jgi:hypothetical protein
MNAERWAGGSSLDLDEKLPSGAAPFEWRVAQGCGLWIPALELLYPESANVSLPRNRFERLSPVSGEHI